MKISASIAGAGFEIDLGSLIAGFKGPRQETRKFLLETRANLNVIRLHKINDFPLDRVVGRLKSNWYDSAVERNVNLKTVKRGKLQTKTIKNVPQFKKYIGWDTEKLLDNYYEKIVTLKEIVELDAGNLRVNKVMRLENIYRQAILIVSHIKS